MPHATQKTSMSLKRVTPAMAATWTRQNTFKDQRVTSRHHVEFLKELYAKGEFDGHEPIRFAKLDNRRILINGLHRLTALADMPAEFSIELLITTTECATEEDVARLYASIDRGRSRSLLDALRGLGAFHQDSGFSHTEMNTILACAPILATELKAVSRPGSHYDSRSAERRLEVVQPYLPAAKRYFESITESSKDQNFGRRRNLTRMLRLREVAVIGIGTFTDHPDPKVRDPQHRKAVEFWSAIAGSGSGLAVGDPRKTALDYLKDTAGAPHVPSFGITMQTMARLWNAWYQGQDMRLPRRPNNPLAPVSLLGTRFDHSAEIAKAAVEAFVRPPDPAPRPLTRPRTPAAEATIN